MHIFVQKTLHLLPHLLIFFHNAPLSHRLIAGTFNELITLLQVISPPPPFLPFFIHPAPWYSAGLPQAQLWSFWLYPFLTQNFESFPSRLWTLTQLLFLGLVSHKSFIHLKVDLIMFHLFSNHVSSTYYVPSLVRDPRTLWTKSKCYCLNKFCILVGKAVKIKLSVNWGAMKETKQEI